MLSQATTSEQDRIKPLLAEANINPESFLATDYLNHFNEIVMLLEMIPDMPELLEDIADWHPKSYPQHFRDSGFAAKDLAIRAFELAPAACRDPFDELCDQLDILILSTVRGLMKVNATQRGLTPQAQALIRARVDKIHTLLMELNQVIHGKHEYPRDDAITPEPIKSRDGGEDPSVQTQADIDRLFD